ncbi:heterogeneous nuclear ribonucleoprotein 1 isoform X1 [Cryptomeria japonica]|uniref:heterogeneous nuclear ribonucleoprotein 1 isoform X1 n=1 Tax=Cryptomeria japonica TaxID=3369 RepID=UPI0025AC4EE4|nr:heterogeneous nuclear ribonucleoprotein 1 isoform X1 [Cryptomeria japonica]XP_057823458.1 heterogeneous nuclear ribonucleoprotein 1 isoform X1 [Cryptomeria japonica]XP_059074438.1 heterogeneous nuclear ribonucleoprotein 1 isoform X1 [Cryptomeria japonica]
MEGSKAEDNTQSSHSNDEENEETAAENPQEEKNNGSSKDSSNPGKIFIGGLSRETTTATFTKYFSKYGELTDSVIMKDRATGNPRGFGFVTYADPSVVDKVIKDKHVIDGKTVEIKRTIPRGNPPSKGPKTKKIFVGGIPTSITEDEFKNYFAKFGKVVEHQIMQDHGTGRSRGFGFVTFDSEQVVDEILSHGKMYELGGKQVEIKKAEPKKPLPDSEPAYGMDGRPPFIPGGRGGYGDAYGGLGGAYSSSYRGGAGFGGRPGVYGGYGVGDYSSAYGVYGGSTLGGFRGDSPAGYGGRFGPYGSSFGSYGSGMLGGYGDSEGFGSYGSGSYGGGYDAGIGSGYGSAGAYGSGRGGGYGGSSSGRYHPYSR